MKSTHNNILLLLLCFFSSFVSAEEQKLHIILKSGNLISMPIAEQPKIVFEDGVMYVGSETLLASNVSKYIIGMEEALTIDAVNENGLRIDADDAANGKVHIENYRGQAIRMFDANGVVMPCKVTVSDTSARVDFSTFPRGIYILSVSDESIKVQKR